MYVVQYDDKRMNVSHGSKLTTYYNIRAT